MRLSEGEDRDGAGMKDMLRHNWALYQILGLKQHLQEGVSGKKQVSRSKKLTLSLILSTDSYLGDLFGILTFFPVLILFLHKLHKM